MKQMTQGRKACAALVLAFSSIVIVAVSLKITTYGNSDLPQSVIIKKDECRPSLLPPPILVDPNGTWSVTYQYDTDNDAVGWTWHSGPGSDRPKYYTTWHGMGQPAYPQFAPGRVSSALDKQNTSLVLYGSSHIREILFALMRLEYGMDMSGTLSRNLTSLPAGTNIKPGCDPTKSGHIAGRYGVDINLCGFPSRRVIQELGPNVAFGFKTFLHTPDAEAHFLEFLEHKGLRYPDIIVMDAGIWGLRGKKTGGSAQTVLAPSEEWQYCMEWIRRSFPRSHILLVHEGPISVLEHFQALAQNTTTPKQRVSILRKDALLQKKPPLMPCAHGCAGPVINTLAVQLVEWLEHRHSAAYDC
jgi:hypothetical protein